MGSLMQKYNVWKNDKQDGEHVYYSMCIDAQGHGKKKEQIFVTSPQRTHVGARAQVASPRF